MTLRERLANILKRKAEGIEAMKVILDSADEEKRNLTEQEEADYTYLDGEVERLKDDEERTVKLINDDDEANTPRRRVASYIVEHPEAREFRSLGEFMCSVRFNPHDERLRDCERYAPDTEQRQQSMGVGAEGGFAIPNQFLDTLLMVDPQSAIFMPRATVLPAGSPPDATLQIPALNQGAASNLYGGMSVQWIAEAGTKPEADLELRQITLTPHEVAAHTILTDKLIRNWSSASSMIERMLRLCVTGTCDTAFYSGSGVGQPLGVLNAPARIDVARTGAGAIAAADIDNMYARAKFGGSLVWIASQTTLPQLTAMVDGGSHRIWVPNATGIAGTPPGTLFGIPVLLSERSVALGTAGDLMLCDLSYYLVKPGSGPFVATSEHVHFTTNRTVIKIFWMLDGQPWLDAPIQLEGAAAGNTISPFVVLQ